MLKISEFYKEELSKLLKQLKFRPPIKADNAELKTIENKPIVYRVIAWDNDSDKPKEITRVCGIDTEGIIDIGESKTGRTRLNSFFQSTKDDRKGHLAGAIYFVFVFSEKFPIDSIKLEYLYAETKEYAEAIEHMLLQNYRFKYMDLPPLNGTVGKYRKVPKWLEENHNFEKDENGQLTNIEDYKRFLSPYFKL